MSTHYNMIKVNGVAVKTPSTFQWSIQDVSASDAGRTQDALMHKMLITRKRKIAMTWAGPSPEETRAILQAFNSEYFEMTYYDPLDGAEETRIFYTGDRAAPFKWWMAGNRRFEQVSFDVIER